MIMFSVRYDIESFDFVCVSTCIHVSLDINNAESDGK